MCFGDCFSLFFFSESIQSTSENHYFAGLATTSFHLILFTGDRPQLVVNRLNYSGPPGRKRAAAESAKTIRQLSERIRQLFAGFSHTGLGARRAKRDRDGSVGWVEFTKTDQLPLRAQKRGEKFTCPVLPPSPPDEDVCGGPVSSCCVVH